MDRLPIIALDGHIVSTGVYLSRDQLALKLGLAATEETAAARRAARPRPVAAKEAIMALPAVTTHYAFFTGKGGVGKTSLSCATGLALSETGKQVLIVSTDPASNLDEVLGTPSWFEHRSPIPGAAGLYALNIDPEAAACEYKERMVGPYRGILPAAAIASMEEQFSGACTVEIAAFDEFAKLLGDPGATAASTT